MEGLICTLKIPKKQIDRFLDLLNDIREVFKEKIADIASLTGGISNRSFSVQLESGKKLVLRLAASDYGEVVDRSKEKHNAMAAAKINVSPKVYSFRENGDEVIEFLELPTMHPEDFQNRLDVMEAAAGILNRFHRESEEFYGIFDPVERIRNFENMAKENGFEEKYEGWERIDRAVERIGEIYKKNPPELCPCHCDTLAENFMYDGKTIKLIDWEFGGMCDPYYDASGVLTENELDENACAAFIRAFCEGEPTEEQKARIYVDRFLYCTYWSNWALAMISLGRDRSFCYPYGEERAKLGISYLDDPNFEGYLKTLENL